MSWMEIKVVETMQHQMRSVIKAKGECAAFFLERQCIFTCSGILVGLPVFIAVQLIIASLKQLILQSLISLISGLKIRTDF